MFRLVVAVPAILAVAACASGTAGDAPMSTHGAGAAGARFLALGDSYTIGEAVAPAERWPERLVASLRAEGVAVQDPTIVARTGWTTDELDAGIDAAPPSGTFDLVTLLIGVNDQYRGKSAADYRPRFVHLLERAIGYAGGDASRVVVLSIPDWGVTPYAAGRDRAKIAADIDAFNAVNRNEARRLGAHHVDVTATSRRAAEDPSLIAPDGLHPAGAMHAEWTVSVLPVARAVLARRANAEGSAR